MLIGYVAGSNRLVATAGGVRGGVIGAGGAAGERPVSSIIPRSLGFIRRPHRVSQSPDFCFSFHLRLHSR